MSIEKMSIQTHVNDLEPVAWALMSLAIILAVVRLVVRYFATRNLGLDDIMIGVATLMDIGGTVALSLAVTKGGLGRHSMTLSPQQNTQRAKCNYAQHLLYIATIATAKLSMTVFFKRLAVKRIHKRFIWCLAGVIAAWAITSEFIIAFQCPMPTPYDPTANPPGACLSEDIWIYIVAVDCLTEAFIMALPIWIVWGVQIPFRKKILIQFLFSIRIVVIAASLTHFASSRSRPTTHFDTSYDQTGYWLWTSLQCTLAIIAACTPALKPFLEYSASRLGGMTGFQRSYGDERSGDAPGKYFESSGGSSGAGGSGKAFKLRSFGGRSAGRSAGGGGGGGGGSFGGSGIGGMGTGISAGVSTGPGASAGSSGSGSGTGISGLNSINSARLASALAAQPQTQTQHGVVVFSDAVKSSGNSGNSGGGGLRAHPDAALGYRTRITGIERAGSSDSVQTEASGAMIIRQTTEWGVDYERDGDAATVASRGASSMGEEGAQVRGRLAV